MTAAEFDVFRRGLVVEYAADQVRTGRYTAEESEGQVDAELRAQLPDGPGTADQLLFTAEDDAGPIGILWLSLTHPRGAPDTGWIYDIEVLPERRGQGFGRALLAAAEHEIAARGLRALGLNVFGDNETAQNLYRSAGYTVTTQQMTKHLTPPA